MQSQVVAQQAQIGQVTGDVANIRTELVGAKTDLVANRLDLASTNAKLDHAVGDLNGQSRLIARTREELEELRHRGDRSYYEFTLSKGATSTPVSTVSGYSGGLRITHPDWLDHGIGRSHRGRVAECEFHVPKPP
jgi:hypothetical protein